MGIFFDTMHRFVEGEAVNREYQEQSFFIMWFLMHYEINTYPLRSNWEFLFLVNNI